MVVLCTLSIVFACDVDPLSLLIKIDLILSHHVVEWRSIRIFSRVMSTQEFRWHVWLFSLNFWELTNVHFLFKLRSVFLYLLLLIAHLIKLDQIWIIPLFQNRFIIIIKFYFFETRVHNQIIGTIEAITIHIFGWGIVSSQSIVTLSVETSFESNILIISVFKRNVGILLTLRRMIWL